MVRYFKIVEITPENFKESTGEGLGYFSQVVSVQKDACYIAVADDVECIEVEKEAMDYVGCDL